MKLKVGSRKSPLAKAQAGYVMQALKDVVPEVDVEWVWITTTGDRIRDRPLQAIGGKGLFLKEIQAALLDGEIDLAIHSGKDVTTELHPELEIVCTPKRGNPFDVLCTFDATPQNLQGFSGKIGTGSDRRKFQMQQLATDAEIHPLRGNIGTRLDYVRRGELQGVVLAGAGLERLDVGWTGHVRLLKEMLPATAQGTLALECRRGDDRLATLLQHIHDKTTWQGFCAERAALATIEGDCMTPFAAYATVQEREIELVAKLWSKDGCDSWQARRSGSDPFTVGQAVGRDILAQRRASS